MEKKPVTENVINLDIKMGNILCTLISVLPYHANESVRKKYFEHHHHYFEVHIARTGEYTFLCNNQPLTANSTDILLIPPQLYHKVIHSSNDCERMNLSFNLKLNQDNNNPESTFYYEAFERLHTPLKINFSASLKRRLSTISALASVKERSFIEQERMRAACHNVLIELFDVVADKAKLTAVEHQTTLPIEYIIDNFFAQNYMDNSAKEKLASQLHVSTRQLHRILMEHYGKNYREKLNEARIQVAAGFLMDSNMSISEISEAMGYSTPENFATFVKNETGSTPVQIRKGGLPSAINKK